MKVGGGCLRDVESIRRLPSLLSGAYADLPRLLVVSAFEKTTNRLLALGQAAARGDLPAALAQHRDLIAFHERIVEALFVPELAQQLKKRLQERYWAPLWKKAEALSHLATEGGPSLDSLLVFGELVSSEIVYELLLQHGFYLEWVDARRLLITDGAYPEPTVLEGPSQASIDAELVPRFRRVNLIITQGYIASDLRKRSVTLGREGSDYSAALFARFLKARGLIAWKDVGRIYAADPKKHSNPPALPAISYAQAAEMTFYGAKILHPRTLGPLYQAKIPLYIRSYLEPEAEGTFVSDKDQVPLPPIYLERSELTLIEVESRDLTPLAVDALYQGLEDEGLTIYFMQGGLRFAAFAVQGPAEALGRWQSAVGPGLHVQTRFPVTLYTVLYPNETVSYPNGNALYFQRLPHRLHWIAYA